MLFPPSLSLYAVFDDNVTAVGAGNSAFDREKIVLSVDLDDGKVLNGNLFSAEVTRHLLALPYSGGRGAGAHGAAVTGVRTGTVGFLESREVPSLDDAGVTLTLALARNVYLVTGFEYVCFDDLTELVCGTVVKSEFLQDSLGCDVSLFEVTCQRLGHVLCLDVAEAYLNGFLNASYKEKTDYDPNSAANTFRAAMGMNMVGKMESSATMFMNRYPFAKALELFGAVEGTGAQMPQ